MSGLTIIRLLVLTVLLLGAQSGSYCQETEEELKETAAKLFDNEQYVDATSLYLRLLALNPRSHDYNFRYGTCLLYNSNRKQDAFRYLNYSISDPNIDIQAYYFLGKAHHLSYQFNEAIKNYELYKQKAGAKIKASLELDRQIEMCQNGKRLLTTITDIIVLEKKEIEISKFFRLYDLQDIGGDLLVAADFQSKVDRKKGHTPLIHLSADAGVIYYSSFGDSDNGQKDIYMRKRLPDGSWGLPQLVPGNVNTKYDEDFPYMHPGGEYLYFCSKGHNSMGGYDIFRSKLNLQNNTFGPPENLDFAISSPDNDLFYVVDSLDNNAYFASSRQSVNGKMFVYKVRVERVPLQLAVIKGNFGSAINPDNKKLSITVTDATSGDKIGTFTTAENGSYLITLPKGGKYTYEMKVGGKPEVHRYTVSVPFSKVFRPLKQKIIEELAESAEVVRVVDLFEDEVDDPMGVLAEVIKQRSELNPNVNQFDLNELDAEKENQRILAGLGFADPSPQAVIAQFEKLENKQQEIVQQSENLANGAVTSAMNKLEAAGKSQEKAKSLVNQANSADTKAAKYELFRQAKEEMDNAATLKAEAKALLSFADSVQKTIPVEKQRLATIEAVTKEVKTAVTDDNTGDLKDIIGRNTTVITSISEAGANDPTAVLIEQKTQLRKEKNAIQAQKDNYTASAAALGNEITALQTSLSEAKKKDQPSIRSAIDSKTQELVLVKEENDHLTKKLETAAKKEVALEKRIAFLNDITQVNETAVPAPNAVQSKLAEVDTKNNNTLAAYINQQVTEMEKDPSLTHTSDPVADHTAETLRNDYESEIRAISSQAGLSEKDKTGRLLKADTDYLASVEEELEKTNAALQQNPADQAAADRKRELNELKSQAEDRVEKHRQELAALNETPETHTATPESELAAIAPDYEEKINRTNGSDLKTSLTEQNAIDADLLIKIAAEQQKTDAALAQNPSDEKAQQRKTALNELKTTTETAIAAREEQLQQLEEAVVADITPQSELEKLNPSYEAELEAASDPDQKTALEAQNAVDNRLLEKIDLELAKTDQTLQSNPADKTAADRKQALTTLKTKTETAVADREEQLAQLNQPAVAAITPATERDNLVPDYQDQIASIDQSDKKTALEEANRIDETLNFAISSEMEEVESQLLRNPENTEAAKRRDALIELKRHTEEQIATRTTELESLQPETVNALAETTQNVRPSYEENKQRIESETQAGQEREIALLKEEQALLSDISEAVRKTESKALKNPEDRSLQQQLEQLHEAESIQEAKVNERQLELIAAAEQQINRETLQAEIAPAFSEELRNSEQLSEDERTAAIRAEENLREALVKRQKANEKQLQKGFDPEIAAENKAIAALIDASQSRVESFGNPSPENPDAIALIENDLGDDAQLLLHSDPQTVAEARRIITELKEYDNQLDEQLESLRSENPADGQAVTDKEAQQAIVRRRIGIVEAELDAMESYVIAGSQENSAEKELVQLSNREQELQQQLASGQLDKTGQRAAEKELKTVQADKQVKEQQILEEKHQQAAEALQPMKTAVQARSDENELARSVQARSEDLTNTPVTEKDPAAMREQLRRDQEALTLLNATTDFLDAEEVYAEKDIVIASTDDLKAQKRRFSIEIGQLEAGISSLRNDPSQTAKVAELERQQRALTAAVLKIDEMIAASEQGANTDNPIAKGLETPVTFEEEQTIASTPVYATLLQQQEEIKTTRRQLNEVIAQKESVRREIARAETPEKKGALIEALSMLEEEQKTLLQELYRQQAALETAIAASGQDPEKIKNLLARDVPVTKPVPAVVALPESLRTGFELLDNPTAVRAGKTIPVGLKVPSGLVYRVQVGAFAKPVPEHLFREFTPVTGEKLTNGITRYLAGYFGNRNRAKEAQTAIRGLGYSDAFIVAYCDGERITLAEARRLEDTGLCVPKNQDSLMLEVVENTLAQLPADSVAKLRPEVKKSDYNKAPGAVAAEAVEDRQGLFFTVQVGVYNRPATREQLRSIDPLITRRLENGQIRYSSGIFRSVEAARPKRIEAITRGITDAFITAYYKGERISLTEAKRLLEEFGESIVEKTQVTELQPDLFREAREYAATQPQPAGVIEKQPVQIVSTRQYEHYPTDELSRYNTYGSFYYDAADKRIKSIVYSSADALPQLRFLGESVDTVFQKNEIGTTFELQQPLVVAEWDKAELEGAFADWLLRLTIPHHGEQTATGFRVVFEDVPAEDRDELLAQLQSYGAATVKLEEQ